MNTTTSAQRISSPRLQRPTRLRALDALRGLALAMLLLQLALRSRPEVFGFLRTRPWGGWSAADLWLPVLVLVSGAAMAFASERWRSEGPSYALLRLLRRAATLLVLGLLLNGVEALYQDRPGLRLPGDLQRWSLVTLLAAPWILSSWRRWAWLPLAAVLVLHAVLLLLGTDPSWSEPALLLPGEDWGARLDRSLFGAGSLQFLLYDPAGLGTVLGVAVTFGMGFLAGDFLRRRAVDSQVSARLGIAGAVSIAAGSVVSTWLPVHAHLWTPSFALICGGWGLLLLALSYEILDVRGFWPAGATWMIFGRNALLGGSLGLIVFGLFEVLPVPDGVNQISVWDWLARAAPSSDPQWASLWLGLGALFLAGMVLFPLHRLRAWLVA